MSCSLCGLTDNVLSDLREYKTFQIRLKNLLTTRNTDLPSGVSFYFKRFYISACSNVVLTFIAIDGMSQMHSSSLQR